MKKKNKKYMLYGIAIVSVIVILLAAGYFMSQQTVLGISKYGLTTDYTILAGTNVAESTMLNTCNQETTRDKENICIANSLISNTYGYGIFKGAAKLEPSIQKNLVASMESLNKEAKKPTEYKQFSKEQKKIWDKTFGNGIFTKTLINKIKTNRFTYYDLKIVATETDTSLNNWCNALNAVLVSGKFSNFYKTNDMNEMDQFIQICAQKPKKIFTVGNDKITMHLNDITLYDYRKYDTVCDNSTIGCDGMCTVTMCHIVELPQTEKTVMGTLQLSKLNLQIRPLGSNDFLIAINDGIQQSNTITTQKDFAKYILQMPTDKAVDITTGNDWVNQKGFIIASTNNQVSKLVKDYKSIQ
jgi:hypothetical protein